MAIFHDVKKMEIYFLYNSFVSYICYQGNFFQEHVDMELKILFVTSEGFFKWQK